MARYRLPDALGGGECSECRLDESTLARGTGLYCRVTVGQGLDEFTIDLLRSLLTEIEPPLPPEPPVRTIVRDKDGDAWIRTHAGWVVASSTRGGFATWGEIQAYAPLTVLVPDPFAEPAELPWSHGGVEVAQTYSGDGPGSFVHVSTKRANHGFDHLKPDVARAMARALWTAANQAGAL